MCRASCSNDGMDLLRTESQFFEHRLQEGLALPFVGASERERNSRPATNRRIERFESIGAHDDDGREVAGCQVIDPTNQSVHAGTILMVHLCKLTGLRKRVGLINQEHYAGGVFGSATRAL